MATRARSQSSSPSPSSRAAASETMLLSRRLDERCIELVEQGGLAGTVLHSSIGQEAVAVGAALPRRDGDVMLSTHRGLAHCVAWGADLVKLVAESFGYAGGFMGGLGGHMHIVDVESG